MVAKRRPRVRDYAKSPETLESEKLLRTPQWKALNAMLLPKGHMHRCHLCDCANAPADALDHLVPRAERPDLAFTASNLAPVHHKACPACGLFCNSLRGNLSVEAGRRKVQRRKTDTLGLEVHDETESTEGRTWLPGIRGVSQRSRVFSCRGEMFLP